MEAKPQLKVLLRGEMDTEEEVKRAVNSSLANVNRTIETLEGCAGIKKTFQTPFDDMPHVGAILTFQRAEQAEPAKRLKVQKVGPKDFKEVLIHDGEPVHVLKAKPLYVKRRNELLWKAALENEAKPNWTVRTLTDRNGTVIAKQWRKTWEVVPQ